MDQPKDLVRTGRMTPCPSCGAGIRHTLLTNDRAPTPFFYAEHGNHVLLRGQDKAQVERLYATAGDQGPALAALADLWAAILDDAPAAPDGGTFGLWAYVTCPHCAQTLTYDGDRRNLHRRIHEPKIIIVDRAVLVGDDADSSWRVRVRLPDEPPGHA